MSDTQVSERALSDARHAWLIGGALLIGSVVVSAPLSPYFGGGILRAALFAAALVVFAFGIRGSGSVTARRPLGTAALVVLAAWVLLRSVAWGLPWVNAVATDVLTDVSYVDSVVQLAAALVAVVQIGRASVVPRPWKWVPAWALGAVVVPSLLGLLLLAVGALQEPQASSQSQALTLTMFVSALDGLARTVGPVFLGVLAIVLGDRMGRAPAVPVTVESGADHASNS